MVSYREDGVYLLNHFQNEIIRLADLKNNLIDSELIQKYEQIIQSYLQEIESIKIKKNNKSLANKYYVEAPSKKSFIKKPKYSFLTTGESYGRLFKEKPVFDIEPISLITSIDQLFDEYTKYGDSLISNFQSYFEELLEIVKLSKPLDENIVGILLIPCFMEGKNIYNTLKKYSACNYFENIAIVILENLTSSHERDNTYSEIEKFRREYPNVILYHIYKEFNSRQPIGFIRKYLSEFALLLVYYYTPTMRNLVLIGGDADCINISNNFFLKIIEKFNSNPNLDAIETKLDFPESYRLAFPNLWIFHRLFEFSWKYMRYKVSSNSSIRMYGPASAIKASSYLMIKGFNPHAKLCEDLQLSWILDQARREGNILGNHFDYVNETIETNPRRSLSTYLSGFSFFDQYNNFDENDVIRDLDWEDMVRQTKDKYELNVGNIFSNTEIRKAMKSKVSSRIKNSLSYNLQLYVDWWQFKVQKANWLSYNQFKDMLDRVLGFIGIDYDLQFTYPFWKIEILSVSKLAINIQEKLISQNLTIVDYQIKDSNIENVFDNLLPDLKEIIVKHYGSNVFITNFYELAGGEFSQVYSLRFINSQNDLIIKVRNSERLLIKEASILNYLSKYEFPIPQIIHSDFLRKFFQKKYYLIISNIPGECLNLYLNKINESKKILLAKKLGFFLANLHKISSSTFGEIIDFNSLKADNNNWKDYFYGAFFNKYLERERVKGKKKVFTNFELDEIESIFINFQYLFENVPISSFLHNDIWEENIIVDRNGDFIGIIDFESVVMGDNEYEVALVEDMIKNWGIEVNYFLDAYNNIKNLSVNYHTKKYFYQFQRYFKNSIGRSLRADKIDELFNVIRNI